MACMCGDTCCRSCGPAQGNNRCEACGAWEADGGCADPQACLEVSRKLDQQFAEWLDESERLAEEWNLSQRTERADAKLQPG